MIKCIFGAPGCGKTTILAKYGIKALNKGINVYTINFELPGAIKINFSDLGIYKFEKCLILIDEITIEADNRDFKTFDKKVKEFFILHRHLKTNIIYTTQNYENADKKIRDVTNELWYMAKSCIPIINKFTACKRIYRKININEYTSDLTLGYRFCSFIESLFASNFELVYRPKYYKYFDTYDNLGLENRPKYPLKAKKINKLNYDIKYYKNKGKEKINEYIRKTNKNYNSFKHYIVNFGKNRKS